ncbi:MAG: MCP four helix bundle domain-containing protein [Desulfatiglandaceae bacterium]
MGLRLKILSGFIILALMLLVAGVWSIYELRHIGSSVQRMLDENYRSIEAAKKMILALEREDSAVLLMVSGGREKAKAIMDSADQQFEENFSKAENNLTIAGERDCVDDIRAKYDHYKKLWTRSIWGNRQTNNLDWYFSQPHEGFLLVREAVQKLMTLNDRTMYDMAVGLQSRAHRSAMPGIVAIVAAFVFSLVFNYLVYHYGVRPIIRIREGVRQFLADGTSFEVKIETEDELRDLAVSISELIALKKTPGA